MFKIVENEDGSTGVYSIDTGKLICSVRGKKNTAANGHPVLKERNASVPAGQKILNEVPLGSSSSEYNLRHLSNREENSNVLSPVLPPLPLVFSGYESDEPCDDCITQDDFLRCTNLISQKKLKKSSLLDLKRSFPLRRISRITVPKSISSGVETIEQIDISSPMGNRVLQSSQCTVDEQKRRDNVKRYDRFCHSVRSNYDVDGCSTPQLRCRDLLRKYPITYKPQKSSYESDHMYTFNKKQRAEKYKIACSGLNKRARRLKQSCQKLTVSVKRLSPQDINRIKRELKKKSVVLGSGNGKLCGSSTVANLHLDPSLKTEISKETIIASVRPYWSSQSVRKPIPGQLIASPKIPCVKKIKLSNNVHHTYLQYSFPKSLQITPIQTPAHQHPPLSSKNNGAFLKLPSGTTRIIPQHLNPESDGREVPLSDISCLDAKRKALSLKKGVCESVASVPLQDVSHTFYKVGDNCYIRGTSIKACGIEEQRENISCVNNIGSIGNPNLSHDHAYHRSPSINSVKPINREPEFGKVEASIKATYGSQTSVLSENCLPFKLPNVNMLLPHKVAHRNAMDSSLKLPEQRLNQPLSSHVLYNNTGNILKSVKPKKALPRTYLKSKSNKLVSKGIPLIDIADDSPDESNSPKTSPSVNCVFNSNGSGDSNLPRVASVKWVFNCYGCGFQCTLKSQDEINEMVLRHMREYHSVNDPASFLSSYFKSSERAVVTEAFPGYKNNRT